MDRGGDPQDHGFRRIVPSFLGYSFAREIEEQIEKLVIQRATKLQYQYSREKVSGATNSPTNPPADGKR